MSRRRRRKPTAVEKAFDAAQDHLVENNGTTNCFGKPSLYTDYESPPADEDAERLCAGCPVLLLCDGWAKKNRPSWGVWGGRVWVPSERDPAVGRPLSTKRLREAA